MKYKDKKIRKHPVIRYLIYLLVATGVISCVSLSRYITSLSNSDVARVAEYDYKVNVTDPNSTVNLPLDPSIYATTMLSDAANCMFDEVAVVREITVTNNSEVSVNAAISSIESMDGNGVDGVVWCILDGDKTTALGGSTYYYQSIIAKLGGSVPGSFSALQAALATANQNTISSWNSGANLGISGMNSSKTFTIVFWSEYLPITDYYNSLPPGSADTITKQIDLTITVTQID